MCVHSSLPVWFTFTAVGKNTVKIFNGIKVSRPSGTSILYYKSCIVELWTHTCISSERTCSTQSQLVVFVLPKITPPFPVFNHTYPKHIPSAWLFLIPIMSQLLINQLSFFYFLFSFLPSVLSILYALHLCIRILVLF